MADIRVIAPDGTPGTIPEERFEEAQARGFKLDAGDGPGAAPASAPEPAGPAEVEVRAPDGTIGTIPAANLDAAKERGFVDVREERYGTTGQKLATVAEGLGRGFSMGATDAVQTAGAGIGSSIGHWLADKAFGTTPDQERDLFDEQAAQASYADIQGRRETNKALSVGSELVGAVAPALASGGVGSAAALARATPAGQLAALSTRMGESLLARAGTSVPGRLGALVATGAAEGAFDNATRAVMDDLAKGDLEISSERMLDAAWDGALFGGAVGGGVGAVAEGVGGAVKLGRLVADKVGDAVGARMGSIGDQAGSAAYKAATGRTSIAAQRLAARVGGDAEIGKTLLKRGVVGEGAYVVDDIAERLPGELEKAGQELGSILDEVGDAATSRAAILRRIEDEVIAPLDKAGTRDVADAVRAKLRGSGIIDELAPSQVVKRGADGPVPVDRDGINLRELHALRRRFDQRPDLKWGSSGPAPVDITTDAMRDVRRTIEDAFENASDAAAKARGVDDYAQRLKQAKREYSHLAVANQVAEQGSFARAANNKLGMNDVLAGVAGAASMGPAGALAAVGSKLIRDRSDAVLATTLHRLAQGGVAKERALGQAVDTTIRSLATKATAATAPLQGSFGPSPQALQQMVAQAQELQDPASPASQQLDAMTLQLASQSPEFAESMRSKVMAKAQMIVNKLGPQTDPADPLKVARMPVDRLTKSRQERFIRAVNDPAAALDRLASGTGSAEDLQVVRELTPGIHKAYVDRVMKQIVGKGIQVSMKQRQKLYMALGVPVERSQTPQMVAFYQQNWQRAANAQAMDQAAAAGQQASNASKPGGNPDEHNVDNRGINRADQLAVGPQ